MSKYAPQNSIPGPPLQGGGRAQYGAGNSIATPADAPAGMYPARIPVPEYNPNALALLAEAGARFVPLQIRWRRDKSGDWALGKPPLKGLGTNRYAGFDLLDATGYIAGLHGGALGLIPASIGMAVVDVDVGDATALIEDLGDYGPVLTTPTPRVGGRHLWYPYPAGLARWVEDCHWRMRDWAGDLRYAKGYVLLTDEAPELLAPALFRAGNHRILPALFMAHKAKHPKSGAGSGGGGTQWENPEDGRKGGEMSGITRRKQGRERKRAALILQAQGYDADAIASELGISRRSVYRYLRPDYLPEEHLDYQRHLPLVA